MSHQKPTIEGMQTREGLHLVMCGNAVEAPPKPSRKRLRWPFFLLLLAAVVAAAWSYRR